MTKCYSIYVHYLIVKEYNKHGESLKKIEIRKVITIHTHTIQRAIVTVILVVTVDVFLISLMWLWLEMEFL
jgi:hypothetical protein